MNQTLYGFIKKELAQTLRNPRMKITLFVTPMIQLCIFGFAINTEITNVKIAAAYDAKDYMVRDIYDHSLASKWFIPATSSSSNPFYLMESNKADVVLIPPAGGFTNEVGRDDGKLQLLINSTNVIKGQSIESYLKSISRSTIQGDLDQQFKNNPINIEERVLFNPDLRTSLFLVPGTMGMIIIITTMILSTLAIVREKELGTFEMLISAPITRRDVIAGKTVPYVVLGMSTFPLILLVAYYVFDVPIRGSIGLLFVASFAYICSAVFLGTFIATFCANQQQAILAVFLFVFPMIMLSGLMFPIENMPTWLQWFAYLDPVYHYIGLLRNIMLKGGGISYIVTHICVLAVMALVIIMFSIAHLKDRLN